MSNGDRTPAKARVTAPLRSAGAAVSPRVEPMATPESFKSRAYSALRDAIVSMDVYRSRDDQLGSHRPRRGWDRISQ